MVVDGLYDFVEGQYVGELFGLKIDQRINVVFGYGDDVVMQVLIRIDVEDDRIFECENFFDFYCMFFCFIFVWNWMDIFIVDYVYNE